MNFIDLDDEVKQKKRIIKYLIESSQGDRGLALTKPEAENVNSLLDACEDIETQATIVLKTLNQSILKDSYSGQESLNRFYTVLRQGLKTLTKTTFRQLPKTDVQNLNDYKDNLEKLYKSLDERFDDLQDILYGNEPLKGRTKTKYEQDTGKPYIPPAPLEKVEKYRKGKREKGETKINKLELLETDKKKTLQTLRKEYERIDRITQEMETRQQDIDQEIDTVRELMKINTADFGFKEKSYIQQMRELEALENELKQTGNTDILRINELKRMNSPLSRSMDTLVKKGKDLQGLFLGLMKLKKDLPSIIAENRQRLEVLEEDIQMINDEGLGLNQLIETEKANLPEDMTEEEKGLYLEIEPKATKLSGSDYDLIMKDFNIFIKSLGDGLLRYTTGLSTKLSKSQETDFRTPVDRAVAKLEGDGMYGGGYIGGGVIKFGELIHRRFL
jgi:hypothetical protein